MASNGTAHAPSLEEGCAPTCQFLSHACSLVPCRPLGSSMSPFGHITHALSYHAEFMHPPCRPSGSSVTRLRAHRACGRPSGTPAGTHACGHACGQAFGHACGQAFGQRNVHRKCSSDLSAETALCIKAECTCLLCSSTGHPHNDFDRTGKIDHRFQAVHLILSPSRSRPAASRALSSPPPATPWSAIPMRNRDTHHHLCAEAALHM